MRHGRQTMAKSPTVTSADTARAKPGHPLDLRSYFAHGPNQRYDRTQGHSEVIQCISDFRQSCVSKILTAENISSSGKLGFRYSSNKYTTTCTFDLLVFNVHVLMGRFGAPLSQNNNTPTIIILPSHNLVAPPPPPRL